MSKKPDVWDPLSCDRSEGQELSSLLQGGDLNIFAGNQLRMIFSEFISVLTGLRRITDNHLHTITRGRLSLY